jgi:YVTN family beta-propeller protein
MNLLRLAFVCFFLVGCTHELPIIPESNGGYPDEVGALMLARCATPGCHTEASSSAAGGLDLSTFNAMLQGTSNGAVVIPFRPDFSLLCYYTNTDSTQGLVALPTMPINGTPLTPAEYALLRDWIAAGAPDAAGVVPFSGDPQRSKFYVINQGCDVATVFDAQRMVAMRMVDLGQNPGATPPESPHNVKVTPDGKYWCVVFLNSDIVQVFDAATDQLIQSIPIGNGIAGGWNTLTIAEDSRHAYAVDYNGGRVAFIDLQTGTSQTNGPFPITGNPVPNLHGVALNASQDTLYVTCQEISKLLKIPVNNIADYSDVNLNPLGPWQSASLLKPHEVIFSPDYSKYFVTCQDTNVNQVRVFSTATDQLLTVIPVGKVPLEMAVSASTGLLFVTNTEDDYFPGIRGSISIIDLNTLTEIKRVRAGWQPHGIAVDEYNGRVIISNRNFIGGTAPHHAASCAGKNGYLSSINLNTLDPEPGFSPEVSVDPYAVSIRRKP